MNCRKREIASQGDCFSIFMINSIYRGIIQCSHYLAWAILFVNPVKGWPFFDAVVVNKTSDNSIFLLFMKITNLFFQSVKTNIPAFVYCPLAIINPRIAKTADSHAVTRTMRPRSDCSNQFAKVNDAHHQNNSNVWSTEKRDYARPNIKAKEFFPPFFAHCPQKQPHKRLGENQEERSDKQYAP